MDQKIKDKDICGLFRTKSKRQILHLLRNEVDNTANMLLKLKSFLIQIEPNEENAEMIRAVNKTLLAMQRANMEKLNRITRANIRHSTSMIEEKI